MFCVDARRTFVVADRDTKSRGAILAQFLYRDCHFRAARKVQRWLGAATKTEHWIGFHRDLAECYYTGVCRQLFGINPGFFTMWSSGGTSLRPRGVDPAGERRLLDYRLIERSLSQWTGGGLRVGHQ